jgi:hypothetical protein
MGARVGGALVDAGLEVGWASEGRSESSAKRAAGRGLADAGSLAELLERSTIVISICPPHAALEVAGQVAGHEYRGVYIDANAIAPRTADEVARAVSGGGASYVDGAIVGAPPGPDSLPRFYFSGEGAEAVASLFVGSAVDARPLGGRPNSASALKVSGFLDLPPGFHCSAAEGYSRLDTYAAADDDHGDGDGDVDEGGRRRAGREGQRWRSI